MSDSNITDAEEFLNKAAEFKPDTSSRTRLPSRAFSDVISEFFDEEEVKPGQSVQYSFHGDGYAPTTATISKLPAGCYDLMADSKAVFAKPMLPPAGLLLELPEMRSEEVLKVVENFWSNEKDYKEGNEFVIGGAVYKGGVLVYGNQGSGKSCTIKLVSKKLIDRDGVVFYSSGSPQIALSFLTEFSRIEPNRKCVVVLEDLDTLIDKFGESDYLELLDSAKTIDNVFFIATTNYPEKLDPRIYNRPGRFSHVIKIGLPTKKAREAYLKAILKNHRDVEFIVENTNNFSIDHLSALVNSCYRGKKELSSEIKRLKVLFSVPRVDDKQIGFGLNDEEKI